MRAKVPLRYTLPNSHSYVTLPNAPAGLAWSPYTTLRHLTITPDLAAREMKGSAQPYHDRSRYPPPY